MTRVRFKPQPESYESDTLATRPLAPRTHKARIYIYAQFNLPNAGVKCITVDRTNTHKLVLLVMS